MFSWLRGLGYVLVGLVIVIAGLIIYGAGQHAVGDIVSLAALASMRLIGLLSRWPWQE
ncbi:MAG: hypothetical protein M3Z18_04610 [Gemmatimonadota bacterium]|nr:hypothetical protein [Gemmatimonadota bacterium]